MGMLIEKPGIYEHMTALENLRYFSLLIGMPFQDQNKILEMVGLQNAGKKKASQFSLGMKQRLGIAISLLGNPDFLILDEPINGLDPEGVYEMRKMLEALNREHGTTIMIASHILSELHKLATDYAIIDGGRLIDEFSKDTLESACSSGVQVTVEPEYLQDAKTLIASRYGDSKLKSISLNISVFYKLLYWLNMSLNGTTGGASYIPPRKEGCSPTSQPLGWLFLFHNEGGF